MPKIVKGGPLGLFKIHSVAEYQITIFGKKSQCRKKLEGGPLV